MMEPAYLRPLRDKDAAVLENAATSKGYSPPQPRVNEPSEWFYACPACVFSRRKSGAETSTVRHISYNLERMRVPMRCSSESSRVAGISLPLGSRVVSPSEAGLSR